MSRAVCPSATVSVLGDTVTLSGGCFHRDTLLVGRPPSADSAVTVAGPRLTPVTRPFVDTVNIFSLEEEKDYTLHGRVFRFERNGQLQCFTHHDGSITGNDFQVADGRQ